MNPIPPCRAIAAAIFPPVTVSIGEDTTGTLRVIPLVSFVSRLTSCAAKSMWPGWKIMSSYVYVKPLVKILRAVYPTKQTNRNKVTSQSCVSRWGAVE